MIKVNIVKRLPMIEKKLGFIIILFNRNDEDSQEKKQELKQNLFSRAKVHIIINT
jgi:hypothetical protein